MPVARFEMPDGRIARFEVAEGTTPEQAQEQISLMISQQGALDQPQSEQQSRRDPQALQDAFDFPMGMTPAPSIPAGATEAGLAVASGAIAEPVAGLAGIVGGLLPGEEGQAAETVKAAKKALTFEPSTPEGRQNLVNMAEQLKPVADLIKSAEQASGDVGFDLAGPVGGAIGASLPTALMEALGLKGISSAGKAPAAIGRVAEGVIEGVADTAKPIAKAAGDLLQTPKRRTLTEALQKTAETGELDVSTAGFKLSPEGRAAKDKVEKAALNQNISDSFVTSLKTASRGDKLKINEMVNVLERRLKDPDFALDNRPTDVIGELVLQRVNSVKAANRTAGNKIDAVAKGLEGKPIDISDAVLKFDDALDSFNVKLIDDGKGGFKPDFSESELPPTDRGPIKEVVRLMNIKSKGGMDALKAHEMKRLIDQSVTYGKSKTAISRAGEGMLKDFRAGIDNALDSRYNNYNKANVEYAETITALNAFQDALPNKIDLNAPGADTAIGTDLRALLSNNTSRQEKANALDTLDAIAKKYAGNGKLLLEGKGGSTPSIKKLIVAADQLEKRFGSFAPTGFQGGIERGVQKGLGLAAEAKTNPLAATIKAGASVVDKVKGVTDDKTFKALRELLKAK